MTVNEACKTSGIPMNEAEILLAHLLKKDRTWIVAHGDELFSEDIRKLADSYFTERRNGKPVAYITGCREFYGRNFLVDASVLIPRQSTEELIALTLEVLQGTKTSEIRDADTEIVVASHMFRDSANVRTIVDIGTGSGCIAITLALETGLHVIATDLSTDALITAQKNAHLLKASVEFFQGNALEPVAHLQEPFLVVSNPPYIPEGTVLSHEVADFEPHYALKSGKDGCTVLRSIVRGCMEHPYCAGFIVECREEQPSLCFPTDSEQSIL